MKLKDAVKFVCHNGCPCYASDIEHYARVVLQDGTTEEMFLYETKEILNKYGNENVLKVNVVVTIEGDNEINDYIIYEFYLDI